MLKELLLTKIEISSTQHMEKMMSVRKHMSIRDRIDLSINFLSEKCMDLEYYFAENDRYPEGQEDDLLEYEEAIEALKDAKSLIEKEIVAAANFCHGAGIHLEPQGKEKESEKGDMER